MRGRALDAIADPLGRAWIRQGGGAPAHQAAVALSAIDGDWDALLAAVLALSAAVRRQLEQVAHSFTVEDLGHALRWADYAQLVHFGHRLRAAHDRPERPRVDERDARHVEDHIRAGVPLRLRQARAHRAAAVGV